MASSPWLTAAGFHEMRRCIFYPKTDLPVPDEALQRLRARSNEDLGITREAIEAACQRGLGEAPASIEPSPEQGSFHRLFVVTRCDRQRFFLRANAMHATWRDFLMLQDAMLTIRRRANGVPFPAVAHVDLSREVCPFDYEIVAEARGRRLSAFDESDAILERLRWLGAVVARVHAIRFPGFGFFDVRPLAEGSDPYLAESAGGRQNWGDYVKLNLDAHVDACRAIGAVDGREAAEIRWLFAEAATTFAAAPGALLHGDLGNHNVFVDETGVSALIDWEDCLVGDPVYDIAFWATFHPERRHAHFLAGYRTVAELPADFARRFWLYFLRVSLAKTVHRHRFGYLDRPDRPPPSRRIQLSLERLRTLAHN